MDKVHQRAITKCRSKIVIDLSSENEFWDKLAEQEIFTTIMLEVIQAMPSRPEKMRKLLDDLIRRGPNAYVNFLYCLDNYGHVHLANIIRETENKIRNPNETVIYERSDSPAHYPTHSSNHGDRHLHPSASAESLSQHNLSNKFGPSSSLPNMSSAGNMVTSPSDESASNHGNTSLSEQDNNTTSQDMTRADYRRAFKGEIVLYWTCTQCAQNGEQQSDPAEHVQDQQADPGLDDSIVVSRSFKVPNPVVENSIREEPIYDVPIDHNPVKEYQNVDNGSIRGKRKLVDHDGYDFKNCLCIAICTLSVMLI